MSGQRTQWNEATRVQMPALVHLTRIGFTYFGKITEDKAGTVYDPDTNILIEVFKSQFAKLNPERAGEAEAILIDASKLGEEYQEGNNKKVRLTPDEIDMIVDTFLNKKTVEDFSVAVSYEDIEAKKCSLAAGQYFDVKIEYVELTQEEFENKMSELTSNLQSYFDEGNALQKEIMEQLKKVKYE